MYSKEGCVVGGVRMGIKTIGVRDQIIRTLLAILMTMVCTLSSVGGF